MTKNDHGLEQIREEVKRFIQEVTERADEDPPTSVITEVEMREKPDGGKFAKEFAPETRTVPHPSQVSHEYGELARDVFEDLAEAVVEGRSGLQPESVEEAVPPQQFQVAQWVEILSGITWKVMDYEGAFAFDEEAFYAVCREHLLGEGSPASYRIIVPLLNVVSTVDQLELAVTDTEVEPHDERPTVIRSLAISEFTDAELSALFTYEGYLNDPRQELYSPSLSFNMPSHKLVIEVESLYDITFGLSQAVLDTSVIGEQMDRLTRSTADRVVTALRLNDAESEAAHGQPYHVVSDWRTYREDVDSVDLYRTPLSGYEPSMWSPRKRGTNYELDQEKAEEFRSFWDRYSAQIGLDDGALFGSQLRRFNSIFTESEPRDRLVDAAIAFEALLLKGPGLPGKRTPLALNGSILLDDRVDYSREELRTFFQTLYFARGEIVHRDNNWDAIVSHNDFVSLEEDSPSVAEFEEVARMMLAETVLAYMDRKIGEGKNIHQTNEELYEAIRTASFPPERRE